MAHRFASYDIEGSVRFWILCSGPGAMRRSSDPADPSWKASGAAHDLYTAAAVFLRHPLPSTVLSRILSDNGRSDSEALDLGT